MRTLPAGFASLLWIFASSFSTAQNKEALPPHFAVPQKLKGGESYEDLKKLLPNLGALKPEFPSAQDLTEAKESFTYLETKFHFEFNLQDTIGLYSYGGHSENMELARSLEVLDTLVTEIEKVLGPSQSERRSSDEIDGVPHPAIIEHAWLVNGAKLSLTLALRPEKCRLVFGSQYIFSISRGFYLVSNGDPKAPRAALYGRKGKSGDFDLHENPASRELFFVLTKLLERGVTGTLPVDLVIGPEYGQMIRVDTGGRPGDDSKRMRRLTSLRVGFPLTIWRRGADGSEHAEVHLSMASLFPEGLEFGWKKIDLKRYEEQRYLLKPNTLHKIKLGQVQPVPLEDRPISKAHRIRGGLAPNGGLEVVAVPHGKDGYTVKVGRVGKPDSFHSLSIERPLGFYKVAQRSEVHWHHSSQFVAFLHRSGYARNDLYLYDLRAGEPVLLRLPNYVQNCVGRVGGLDTAGTSFTKVVDWKENQLNLTLSFNTEIPDQGKVAFRSSVALNLEHRPTSKARVRVDTISMPRPAVPRIPSP